MNRNIKSISDCKTIIAIRVGPGAIDVLISYGIKPYIASTFIDEALKQLVKLKKSIINK